MTACVTWLLAITANTGSMGLAGVDSMFSTPVGAEWVDQLPPGNNSPKALVNPRSP